MKAQKAITPIQYAYYPSPIGLLEAGATAEALVTLYFVEAPRQESGSSPVLDLVIEELVDYFAGQRTTFTMPLYVVGTPFQQQVWQQLLTVPY